MGAYENPQIIVDTQSGQYLRSLQESLAGNVAKFGQTYQDVQAAKLKKLEESKKENENIKKEVEQFEYSLMSAANKLKSTNDKIDLSKTFEPLIKRAVELKSGLLNNTLKGEERQKAMQEMADINSTVENDFSISLAGLSGMYGELEGAMANGVGEEGGLASSMPPKTTRALNILSGKLPGSKEAVYEDGNVKNLVWIVRDDKGEEIERFYASSIKKMTEQNVNGIKILPDTTANTNAIKSQATDIFVNEPIDSKDPSKGTQATGEITSNFLKIDPVTKKVIYREVELPNQPGIVTLYAEVDKETILGELKPRLRSQLAGMDDATLSDYYNDLIIPHRQKMKQGIYPLDSDKVLDPREREEAESAYIKYWMDKKVPKEQVVQKIDSDIYILDKDAKQGSKVLGKGDKENEPSAADKKLAAQSAEITKTMKELKQGQQKELKYDDRTIYYDGSKWTIPAVGDRAQVVLEFKKAAEHYLRTGIVDKSIK